MSHDALRDLLLAQKDEVEQTHTPMSVHCAKWTISIDKLIGRCHKWLEGLDLKTQIASRLTHDSVFGDFWCNWLEMSTPLGLRLTLCPGNRFAGDGTAELRCCDRWFQIRHLPEPDEWVIDIPHQTGDGVSQRPLDQEWLCYAVIALVRDWEKSLGWMKTGPFSLCGTRHEGVEWRFNHGQLEFRSDPDAFPESVR